MYITPFLWYSFYYQPRRPAGRNERETQMTETMLTQEEIAAAELEALAPMPADLIPLREEKRQLDDQLEILNARVTEIKETFAKRLEEEGKQGYLLHGKVHARVSHGTRTGIDSKKLKEQMPHIWERFVKVTKYRSVRVD